MIKCPSTSRRVDTTSTVNSFTFHTRVDNFSAWLRQCHDINTEAFFGTSSSSDSSSTAPRGGRSWQLQLRAKMTRHSDRPNICLYVVCSQSTTACFDVHVINARDERIRLTAVDNDEEEQEGEREEDFNGSNFRRFKARKSTVLCENIYDKLAVNDVVIVPDDSLYIVCTVDELVKCEKKPATTSGSGVSSASNRSICSSSRRSGSSSVIKSRSSSSPRSHRSSASADTEDVSTITTTTENVEKPDKAILDVRPSSDTTVEARGGKRFRVHGAVLANQSSRFRSMLQQQRGQDNDVLRLSDVGEAAVAAIVSFLYTGHLPGSRNKQGVTEWTAMMGELIHAAEYYAIDGLKEACVQDIDKTLDTTIKRIVKTSL